jgi:transposase
MMMNMIARLKNYIKNKIGSCGMDRELLLCTIRRRVKKKQENRPRVSTLSKPLMDEFFLWIEQLNALPNTLLGKASHYARSQRKYLERYLLDGRLEISNNRAERSIKPFVIGRNYVLFSNTPSGARASAIYYSLIVTARENGLIPFEYLTWILTNIPNLGKPGYVQTIEDFLPSSTKIPQKAFVPKPKGTIPEKYAWEED